MTNYIPKNVKEAIDIGYEVGDRKYSRGYISRKINTLNQPIKIAGGTRKGELYYEIPSYNSTTYIKTQNTT